MILSSVEFYTAFIFDFCLTGQFSRVQIMLVLKSSAVQIFEILDQIK